MPRQVIPTTFKKARLIQHGCLSSGFLVRKPSFWHPSATRRLNLMRNSLSPSEMSLTLSTIPTPMTFGSRGLPSRVRVTRTGIRRSNASNMFLSRLFLVPLTKKLDLSRLSP